MATNRTMKIRLGLVVVLTLGLFAALVVMFGSLAQLRRTRG